MKCSTKYAVDLVPLYLTEANRIDVAQEMRQFPPGGLANGLTGEKLFQPQTMLHHIPTHNAIPVLSQSRQASDRISPSDSLVLMGSSGYPLSPSECEAPVAR